MTARELRLRQRIDHLTDQRERFRTLYRRWQNRSYRLEAQRDLWKQRYEGERRLRLAQERALVNVGREAA